MRFGGYLTVPCCRNASFLPAVRFTYTVMYTKMDIYQNWRLKDPAWNLDSPLKVNRISD
jgi:hypothetical protein|tara:strand:- start:2151 stop:2327 length:177 start_codon:yes stop_codon:yes gene_type:complete